MLPLQEAWESFLKCPLRYSDQTGELLKWQLCGGHCTRTACSWAAQWRRCRLYRVVNLHGASSAKVWERKGILTSESQIRKRDFTLAKFQSRLCVAQVHKSSCCQVHTTGPGMTELGEDSPTTQKKIYFFFYHKLWLALDFNKSFVIRLIREIFFRLSSQNALSFQIWANLMSDTLSEKFFPFNAAPHLTT